MCKEFLLKKTKKRPNRAWIWNDNWMEGCYVLWPVDSKQFDAEYRNINRKCSREKPFEISKHGAHFVSYNDLHCIAFNDNVPNAGAIAHEAHHYVNFILEDKGVHCDPTNDEAHAYYEQWLVNKLYNLTRRGKCKS